MLTIFDTGHKWVPEMVAAAKRARLFGGPEFRVTADPDKVEDLVFFPMNQFSPKIDQDRRNLSVILNRSRNTVQDSEQLRMYERKVSQCDTYREWIPKTWIFTDREQAVDFADRNYESSRPVISKSTIGSSSHNVRLLSNTRAMLAEAEFAFGDGFEVQGGWQQGYVLWQEYVPHDVTWRVTVLGRQLSFYCRFNYVDRPMAAPASEVGFAPVTSWSDVPTSLLEYANAFFNEFDLKFCAADFIPYGDSWRLLETATSWARSYKPHLVPWLGTKYTLATQFDLLMEEIKAGVWN